MAKKKKKNINQYNKQEFARHRNEYFKELKNVFHLFGCAEVFPLIPRCDYDRIFRFGASSIPIEKAPGKGIRNDELAFFTRNIKLQFKDPELFNMVYNEKPLTINYVLTYIVALKLYSSYLSSVKSDYARKIKEMLDERIDYDKFYSRTIDKIANQLLVNGDFYSRFDWEYLWFDIKSEVLIKEHSTQILRIILHKEMAVKRSLEIDGKTRTIFRVATPAPMLGLRWASLNASLLNKEAKDDQEYDIYIQSHAIRRFYERLNCVHEFILNFHLVSAFLKPNVIHFNNTNLIEFSIFGSKVGYFPVELVGEIALIRTFLFITNNGTPEGQKLEQICGLKKHDKAYWNIDKLSAFKNSDIAQNTELRKIFVEAGCSDILDADLSDTLINETHIEEAEQLLRYMKKREVFEPELV